MRLGPLVSAVLLLSACNGNAPLQAPTTSPGLASARLQANPNNVLSALITFDTEGDSARVVYAGKNQPPDSTPFIRLHQGTDTIAVLGLRPRTTYRGVIEISNGSSVARSDTLVYTTEDLPDLVRRISITTTGNAGSSLTLTSAQVGGDTVVAFAFDSSGTIRWYRRFPGKESVSGDLKQQPNGDFTLFRGLSFGSQHVPGEYIEFTPAGDSVRSITVAPPRYLDNHELLMTTGPDGKQLLHFFEYEHRPVNLSFVGVPSELPVAGHQLVRVREDGSTEFEWNAWDHVAPEEWIEPPPPDPLNPGEPDYDHPNSLTFDRDGNYVASFRHLGQIMKINARSGEIMWRLGGTKNQFTFRNDPLNGFSAQHSARIMANGNLLLYDNGTRHNPPESRAVEYALDTTAMTATLVWQFRHAPIIYTPYVGLVQRLSNGNTSIAYAEAGHVTEVSGAGTVLWEADVKVDGNAAFCYRLSRIVSLYRYQAP
jgi:arylsulfotransferase ASST